MRNLVCPILFSIVMVCLSSCTTVPPGLNMDNERIRQDYSNRTISVFPFFEGTIFPDTLCTEPDSTMHKYVLVSMQQTLEELHGDIKVQGQPFLLDFVPPNDTTSYRIEHMGEEYATIVGVTDEGHFLMCDWFFVPHASMFDSLGYEPDIVLVPTWMTVYHLYETTTVAGMEIDRNITGLAAELRFILWDYRESVPLVWGETSVWAPKNDYDTLGKRLLVNALLLSRTLDSNIAPYERPHSSSTELISAFGAFF